MGQDEDTKVLHSMGYAQELSRRMRCILELRNFVFHHLHPCWRNHFISARNGNGGGFQATVGWIVGGVFALIVATSLGQIASAYPTAGGLYHWSSILGGRGWGWATAWINLLGLIFVVASVNVGVWLCFATSFSPAFSTWTSRRGPRCRPTRCRPA